MTNRFTVFLFVFIDYRDNYIFPPVDDERERQSQWKNAESKCPVTGRIVDIDAIDAMRIR